MFSRHLLTLVLPTLLLGGAGALTIASGAGSATASARSENGDARAAAAAARRATKALLARDTAGAIAAAESAVALSPRLAEYRALLGRSYLAAGRFASARASFADASALDPANGKTALNLALAMIATGERDGARQLLATHEQTIPATDLGLALALAGDPARAITVLTHAARAGAFSATGRQNLALAYALDGQWTVARVIIAADMPAGQVDARLEQWAILSQPRQAADQVASLLGVVPAVDPGRPSALALGASETPVTRIVAALSAVAAPLNPAPVTVEAPALVPARATPRIVFAERREQVQALPPTRLDAARVVAVQHRSTGERALEKGRWYVQIGAFDNIAIAQDNWARAARRFPALAGRAPSGVAVRVGAQRFYRLSVGGFSQDQAARFCRSIRRGQGACFIRTQAGDRVANWARGRVQLAAR